MLFKRKPNKAPPKCRLCKDCGTFGSGCYCLCELGRKLFEVESKWRRDEAYKKIEQAVDSSWERNR